MRAFVLAFVMFMPFAFSTTIPLSANVPYGCARRCGTWLAPAAAPGWARVCALPCGITLHMLTVWGHLRADALRRLQDGSAVVLLLGSYTC